MSEQGGEKDALAELAILVEDRRYSDEFIGQYVRNHAPPGRRATEYGFLYDGSPEWSSHAYVKWDRPAAEHYREDAILWRVPDKVGEIVRRDRTSYADSVGDWTRVTPPGVDGGASDA